MSGKKFFTGPVPLSCITFNKKYMCRKHKCVVVFYIEQYHGSRGNFRLDCLFPRGFSGLAPLQPLLIELEG